MALNKNVAKGIKTRQENELLENNQLIAEFMKVQVRTYTHGGTSYNPDKCWELLMCVVDKIESFQDGEDGDSMRGHLYNFRIEQHFVYILDGESMYVIIEMNGDSKRDATYKAVVEFIKWYNENKED